MHTARPGLPSTQDWDHDAPPGYVLVQPLPCNTSEYLGRRSARVLAPQHPRKVGAMPVVRSALAPCTAAYVGWSRYYCPLTGALELAGWPGFSAGQYCLRRWCTPAGGCRNTSLCLRVDDASPSPRPTLQ